jgi:hypothetical protein
MNDKIRPIHLERAAYVYIRQSSLHQVRHHLESKRRQYELKARAQELGFAKVVVIDEDLGISGAGSKASVACWRRSVMVVPERYWHWKLPVWPATIGTGII